MPDDKLRDTHQLHFMKMMGFAGAQPILRLWRTSRNIVARMERSEIRDSRDTGPGLRGACHRAALRADPLAPSGLQRRDLPVGRFVDRAVESFISDFPKNICCHLTQIRSRTVAIPPHQRGVS